MTIEEKAKHYDEAIEYAHYLINERCKEGTDGSFHRADLDKMFPALKKSEDERIRKALIEHFKWNARQILNDFDNKDVLAWLEKHEEDTYDYKRVDLDKFDERIQEFSDMLEDKPKPYWDGWYEAMEWIRTHGNPFKKQGEQKTAWSEEDEKMIKNIEESLLAYKIISMDNDAELCNYIEKEIDWLKSLKERYTWKPSDEQMHYLYWIANVKLGDSVVEQEVSKHLNGLYQDLKKLKGE